MRFTAWVIAHDHRSRCNVSDAVLGTGVRVKYLDSTERTVKIDIFFRKFMDGAAAKRN